MPKTTKVVIFLFLFIVVGSIVTKATVKNNPSLSKGDIDCGMQVALGHPDSTDYYLIGKILLSLGEVVASGKVPGEEDKREEWIEVKEYTVYRIRIRKEYYSCYYGKSDVAGIIQSIDKEKIIIKDSEEDAIEILLNGGIVYYDGRDQPGLNLKEISFSSLKIGDWIEARGYGYSTNPVKTLKEIKWISKGYLPGEDQSSPTNEYESASCPTFPNGSEQLVHETNRVFINMPRDVYPFKNKSEFFNSFETVRGSATVGWVSNGGPDESMAATEACSSYYVEFNGDGEIEFRVKSSDSKTPDYFVRFIVQSLE